jgi:hypothetical protein
MVNGCGDVSVGPVLASSTHILVAMSCRRWCWMVAMIAMIASMTACGDVVARGSDTSHSAGSTSSELGPTPRSTVAVTSSVDPISRPAPAVPGTTSTAAPTTAAPTSAASTSTSTTVRVEPTKTSCGHLAYIGDSVSLGMISAATLPNPSARLDARMAEIGVFDLRSEISGGRSIVETLIDQENAVDVALRLRNDGFSGCWVVAIGTNDAANIAAGGARQAEQRIALLMSVIGTDPVLWVDAATVTDAGYWASANMEAWNAVLTATAPAYPNLRIARWSGFVVPEWFTSDGIHPTAAGAAARVQFIASALIANLPLETG